MGLRPEEVKKTASVISEAEEWQLLLFLPCEALHSLC